MTAMATTGSGYGSPRNWTFLTNHGHVLLAIARNPTARLRDLADEVGVTEGPRRRSSPTWRRAVT